MTLDGDQIAAIGVVFTTTTGAVGWLVSKLWSGRDAAQDKLYAMLEKQFDDQARRKDLFENLNNSVKDLVREVQAMPDRIIQRIRP